MACSANGVLCSHDAGSTSAMSPFAMFCKLQHACGMRTVDQCRRHLLARQALRGPGCKRQRTCGHTSSAIDFSRTASTTCRAQAVADPLVTGQSQTEATPNSDTGHSPSKSSAYPFEQLEAKWQNYWLQHKTFRTPDIKELDKSKPKFYALDMFPYPRFDCCR